MLTQNTKEKVRLADRPEIKFGERVDPGTAFTVEGVLGRSRPEDVQRTLPRGTNLSKSPRTIHRHRHH